MISIPIQVDEGSEGVVELHKEAVEVVIGYGGAEPPILPTVEFE